MTWNFFSFSHGKGGVDGVGTLCKWEIRKEEVKLYGLKLQSAHEVVLYLKIEAEEHHASHNNASKILNKFLWELKVGDINWSHH
jgi:hypothetical protein